MRLLLIAKIFEWKRRISFGLFLPVLCFLEACSFQSMNLAFEALLEARMACLLAGNSCVDAVVTPPPGDTTPPTVAILNLPVTGKPSVQTGFLYGTATDDTALSSVEISIDGGTYSAATGTASWSFALPSGSSTWKLGTLHTVDIRSLDSSGNYSTVISLNLRKGKNRDLNGDGYADVVILASGASSGAGAAFVFWGGPSGISATDTTGANQVILGEQAMGYAAAMGDVNGDGYGDLAIGASDYNAQQGRTYIFHGSSTGFTVSSAASANLILTYPGSNEFGYTVAIGDVNGDGYDDLATSAYHVGGYAGLAFVYYSAGSTGISSTAGTSVAGPSGSNFSAGIGLGDINGDGYDDLIAGANGYSGNFGGVWVFHSSGTTGVTATSYTAANTSIIGEMGPSDFGIRIQTGDVNGDGRYDLIVASPQYTGFFGAVYVFNSPGATGITVNAAASATTIIHASVFSGFGAAIAVGDVDGDGYDDMVSGAPTYNSGQGRVSLYKSTGTVISSTPTNTVLGEAINQYFGTAVSASDTNGDGFVDLIVGAHTYPDNVTMNGKAYIFQSAGASGFPATANTAIVGVAGSHLGVFLTKLEEPRYTHPKFFESSRFFLLEPYRFDI
ncbi:VCBS repeat-containing protein [Leptospira wolffii]|nr:VCBS repeat-containing protein [Leptospira wolffii]